MKKSHSKGVFMNRIDRPRHSAEKNAALVNAVIDEAAHKVSGVLDDVKEQGEKWLGKAKERGVDFLDDAHDRGAGALQDVRRWIRQNPGPAVAWAMAAGAFLYSYLMRAED
jgi:hypothetical protein